MRRPSRSISAVAASRRALAAAGVCLHEGGRLVEAQAQRRQRCAELVGRVPGEGALGFDHALDARGHGVERRRQGAGLGWPGVGRHPGGQVTGRERVGGGPQPPERPGDGGRQHDGDGGGSGDGHRGGDDQPTQPVGDAAVDLSGRIGEAYGAEHPVARAHRDRDVHERFTERSGVALAGGEPSLGGRLDLGAVGVRLADPVRAAARGDRLTAVVGDHDGGVRLRCVVRDRRAEPGVLQARRALQYVLRLTGENVGVPLQCRLQPVPFDPLEVEGQRDVLHDQHDGHDADEGRGQPPSHAGTSRRKPTPRTAAIQRGSPSFLRRAATWASSVFVGPYQWASQTCSRMSVRRCTTPGSAAR